MEFSSISGPIQFALLVILLKISWEKQMLYKLYAESFPSNALWDLSRG